MTKLNALISFVFTRTFYHKAFSYGLLIFFLYFFSSFALIFFLTFIFAFLFYSSAKFIKEKIDTLSSKKMNKKSTKIFFKKYFNLNIIIILEYIIFLIFFIGIISNAIPKLQSELTGLSQTIPVLGEQFQNAKNILGDINNNYTQIGETIKKAYTSNNYNIIINVFNNIKNAGAILLKFIFSLILSLVFLLDRKKLKNYLSGIKKSNFSFLYHEYKIIFDKIVRSFGLILKAQSLIALVNATLTIIGLFIIGTIFTTSVGFPYLLTLGLVVFIFGFVPVIGVFLSSIPIMIVGFSATGTFAIVIAIILLIFIIHIIEAYYLNPRIVSNFLELPVSLTFIILFIGEHLFGIAGLLIGVSLFYFIIELLKDIDIAISKKNKVKKLETKIIKRAKKSA